MIKWSKELCQASAAKYQRRSDWSKNDQSAYAAAKRNGWFDECVGHMGGNRQWTKSECVEVAKTYANRNAFKRGNCDAYSAATYNGWLEECCAHMVARHEEWTLDKCKAIASTYEVQTQWKKGDRNSYFAAYRNGWLEECCAHMDKFTPVTFAECKTAALKYNTRTDWKSGDKLTYRAAFRNGWSALCTEHMGEPNTISSVETEVFEYVKSLRPDAVRGDRVVLGSKREIDIYVPALRIGIEFNGLEWHCDKRGRNINYHQVKSDVAGSRGVRLVHIWSDEWRDKPDVIKAYLRRLVGENTRKVLARRCELVPVTSGDVREFLETNHIQGAGTGAGFALIHDGEMVAAGLVRINRNNERELVRWCVKADVDVVGGFSRVMSRFGEGIITFCDTTKFDGAGYVSAGWDKIGEAAPVLFYTDKNSAYRIPRDNFRKSDMLTSLAAAGFTKEALLGKSEVELAKMLGLNRIAGCKLLKFCYTPS